MKKILLNGLVLMTVCLFTLAGCKDDLDTSREQDEQELRVLYLEIETMVNQTACNDAAGWKFVAIGDKACGGPTGYIAFSKTIDETLLLKKVNTYTEKQKEYNIRWNIASDCMFVTAPKGVECVSGKPKFVY